MLEAILRAIAESKERKGFRPGTLRLPSCMFRALLVDVEPLLGYPTGGTHLSICGCVFEDLNDGT